jgi:N-acetylmuramoyl-L-alanine amidase
MTLNPMFRRRRVALAAAAVLLIAALATTVGGGNGGASSGNPPRKKSDAPTPVDRALFAPSACISYPPTKGNRHLSVFLDAGHGGLDPGSVGITQSGKTIYEADLTLPVELDTMALLRAKGFTVVVSRTKNSSVARLKPDDVDGKLLTAQGVHDDVAARAVCANDAHANILIGIYFDAGARNNAGSVTGYDAVRSFASKNLRLATLVQHDVMTAMNRRDWGIPNEGVQTDNELGSSINSDAVSYGHLMLIGPADPGFFSTPTEMPGALIEPLFITDPFEGSIADSRTGQEVIAGGLARAAEQYFGPAPSKKAGGKKQTSK